ncbi:helix-turn-helix transcriptional regulator [Curtobacterium sp. UNCCL20]|uniref:helix-turn-helix transcriptional regulator n=1 Tax=Curtobacterium sp. UNCCL20 TaxID=1502773 RepID=UPI0011144772|nr:helix-turn-helix transcriptional regulator [Curtobacterium sp. UNCCL20]
MTDPGRPRGNERTAALGRELDPANEVFLEQYWAHVVAHARFVLDLPGTSSNPVVREATEQYLEAVRRLVPSAHRIAQVDAELPPMVQRASAFIRDNLHRPVSATEIAEAAGSSLRAVQGAFKITLGITPMQYLLNARIEAAHAQLLADPTLSVGSLARRWGFSNHGRFSMRYREVYGESPTETRRRLESAGALPMTVSVGRR